MLKHLPRPIHGSAGTIVRHFTTAFSRRTSHAAPSEQDHDLAASPLSRNTLLKPHLNFKYFVENADAIANNIQNRNLKGADIHAVTNLYAQYTSILTNLNNLRGRRNEISALSKAASSSEDRQPFIDEGRHIKETIQAAKNELSVVEDSLLHQGLQIPNDTHPSSPIGPELNARVLKTVGTPRTNSLAGFELKDHVALANTLGLVDWEAASLVSGTSFYYLKNDAALLELALVQYAVTRATARGFVPVITPDIVRTEMAYACGFQPRTNEMSQIYDVTTATQVADAPRLCLVGTAEIPLAGMHAQKLMDEKELPVRLVGFGRAFRAEAGARGADTRGLYRVHQFSKVELFALTKPAESEGMMEEIRSLQEEIFGDLGLCFRVLDMPTEELGASAYRKYDIEAWMPGRYGWGEISSTSNCTDYQSRRLGIRYRPASAKQGSGVEYTHTLNGTAIAVPRIIIAILENFQLADGSVVVPKVLRSWMGGKEVIKCGA